MYFIFAVYKILFVFKDNHEDFELKQASIHDFNDFFDNHHVYLQFFGNAVILRQI